MPICEFLAKTYGENFRCKMNFPNGEMDIKGDDLAHECQKKKAVKEELEKAEKEREQENAESEKQ